MKCPHCHSHMDNYQTSTEERSQVRFYKCTVCQAEHVTASRIAIHQILHLMQGQKENTRRVSQFGY